MNNISENDNTIHPNAVSVYTQNDPNEEFPVLKAFQQYIDAEQNKARKRMLMLCIFFGVLMTVMIVVFVIMFRDLNMRNQSLNDRLVDYAMNDRESRHSPVVVQQPAVDNSAIMHLTSKMEELQKQLAESRDKEAAAEAARKKAEIAAEKRKAEEKKKAADDLEIMRLKALLAEQKAKTAEEAGLRRRAELESYRMKQYPELYLTKKPSPPPPTLPEPKPEKTITAQEVSEESAISYFQTEDEEGNEPKNYSIPVEVKGSSSRWRIPNY